ncbi:hypothetical protein ACIPQC_31600 [[Kitasatospora] papulosa]|uniref:hypothetical protein n=1 Tax=[Kitasatospora] papulosa TaxID=1464011 RepID=UPI00382A76E1
MGRRKMSSFTGAGVRVRDDWTAAARGRAGTVVVRGGEAGPGEACAARRALTRALGLSA